VITIICIFVLCKAEMLDIGVPSPGLRESVRRGLVGSRRQTRLAPRAWPVGLGKGIPLVAFQRRFGPFVMFGVVGPSVRLA
jgi:hypothetical protein